VGCGEDIQVPEHWKSSRDFILDVHREFWTERLGFDTRNMFNIQLLEAIRAQSPKMQALARTVADVVYILDTELIAKIEYPYE
jgi:hypothetical protein